MSSIRLRWPPVRDSERRARASVLVAVLAGNGHDDVIGVDLGVLRLAALSTGETIAGPKALRRSQRRLRRLQRTVSRRCRGSARRGRARRQLARTHRRVADLRKDCLHKLTTER